MTLTDNLQRHGSVERETTEVFGIVRMEYSDDLIDFPAYFGLFKGQVLDSEYGTTSWRGLGIVKQAHKYDSESAEDFRRVLENLDNITEESIKTDSKAVKEVVNEAAWRIYHVMLEQFEFYNVALGGNPLPEHVWESETELFEVAREMMRDKFVRDSFRAYLVEKRVKEDLEDWGYEVVATREEIAKHTEVPEGYDSFESAGYDLYLPEEDTVVQVKEGRGGATDDESDVLARLIWEDTSNPHINYTTN